MALARACSTVPYSSISVVARGFDVVAWIWLWLCARGWIPTFSFPFLSVFSLLFIFFFFLFLPSPLFLATRESEREGQKENEREGVETREREREREREMGVVEEPSVLRRHRCVAAAIAGKGEGGGDVLLIESVSDGIREGVVLINQGES